MKKSGGPRAFAVASIVNNPSPPTQPQSNSSTPTMNSTIPANLKESLPVIQRQQSSDVP